MRERRDGTFDARHATRASTPATSTPAASTPARRSDRRQRPSAPPAGLRGSDAPTWRRDAGSPCAQLDDLGAADGDGVEGADRPHPVAVAGEPVEPGRGASASTSTVRSSPHHRRNGPAEGASRVSAGALTAVAGSCPVSSRRARSCTMICGWASPPMAPDQVRQRAVAAR